MCNLKIGCVDGSEVSGYVSGYMFLAINKTILILLVICSSMSVKMTSRCTFALLCSCCCPLLLAIRLQTYFSDPFFGIHFTLSNFESILCNPCSIKVNVRFGTFLFFYDWDTFAKDINLFWSSSISS